MSLVVLAVCTGNVCRSPAVEMMLRHGVHGLPGLAGPDCVVRSAGTAALAGQPMDSRMVEALDHQGTPVTGFTARQLEPDMIEAADLIITADRGHRSVVVGQAPGALDRTFTLLEFARYCAVLLERNEVTAGGASVVDELAIGSLLTGAASSADRGRAYVRAEEPQAQRVTDLLQFVVRNRGLVHPVRPQDDDVTDPWRRSRRAHRSAARSIETSVALLLRAAAGI